MWESQKIVQNISPHFCDRMRWTRCAQIVFRYLPRFPTVWAASQKFIDFGICSPVKGENGGVWAWNMRVRLRRAKATPFGFCLKHCLRQLRNSSTKIYSCYDRQLYSRLQISHKIEGERQLQGFINLAKSHGSLLACWCNIGKSEATFCGKEGEGVA